MTGRNKYLVSTGSSVDDMDFIRRWRLYFLRSEKPVARHFYSREQRPRKRDSREANLYEGPVTIVSQYSLAWTYTFAGGRSPAQPHGQSQIDVNFGSHKSTESVP